MLGQLIVTFRFETRTTTELYLKGCLTCSQKIYMPRKSSLFFLFTRNFSTVMLLKSERLSFHRIMINFLTVDNFFTQLHSRQKLSRITTTIMFPSQSDAGSSLFSRAHYFRSFEKISFLVVLRI